MEADRTSLPVAVIDGGKITDRAALHAAFAAQLGFPDWYGANLDALADMLSERPAHIVITDGRALKAHLGDDYDALMLMLGDLTARAGVELEYAHGSAGETVTEAENAADGGAESTLEEARKALYTLQDTLAAYDHAMALLTYDGSTTAPKGTGANRARTMAVLSEAYYRESTGEKTVQLLDYLHANRAALSEQEQRMVFLLRRELVRLQCIPVDEYVAYEKLVSEADDVWHRAKLESDFAAFEPYLTRIFETVKRFAGYCAPGKDPYDYWLGEFEEGLTQAKLDTFFAALRERIVPLLERVKAAPQIDNDFLHCYASDSAQDALSRCLMEMIGLDLGHVGIALTEHPFTTSLGSHEDERISTRYISDDFTASMFSVIHEGGHALYDTGSDAALARTVLDGGVSMGVHESQSRFYENLLARSRAFCGFLWPALQRFFPAGLAEHTAEDFYRAVNRVEPSLIRTEADELTYCLHVMVRYELEKQVMAGTLAVHDLPQAWNALYREYLGIEVPDDRHGVLQDSHWSTGLIGYFPSYALGSAYGAQLLERMRQDIDVDGCLANGDFETVNAWNREHIWRFGKTLPPGELFRQAAGAEFDPNYYIEYLEKKYSELYGLNEK